MDTITKLDSISFADSVVTSVNGKTGAVVLTTTDISEGTNLYFTEARATANFKTQSSTELTDSGTLLRKTDTIKVYGGKANGTW